jgi:hypothetical protein
VAADDGCVTRALQYPSAPALAAGVLRARLWASVLALLFALGLAAAPAGAAVVKAEGDEVGLQQRSVTLMNGSWGWNTKEEVFVNPSAFEFANPGGEPVLPATHLYAIYWDPKGTLYNGDWQEVINEFFTNMGSASGSLASVFAVDAQYTDRENQHAAYNSTFMGAYTDTDRYPAAKCVDPHPLEGLTQPDFTPAAVTCLTDAQIQEELKLFIEDHSNLPKGMGTVYYLLTPPGVTVCLGAGAKGHCSDYHKADYVVGETKTEKEAKEIEERESEERSFCSYHSEIGAETTGSGSKGGPNTILYSVIPWIAGVLADGHYPTSNYSQEVACQDGGYNPASKPIEQHEAAKEETKKKEEEELEKETPTEVRAKEKQKLLEGPHVEEPNQPTVLDPDGYYDKGLADLIVNQIAVEQQDVVTDPLLDSWRGQEDVKLRDGEEVSFEADDECRNYFAPIVGGSVSATETAAAGSLFNQSLSGGSYYLNDGFDLAALELPYPGVPCRSGVELFPQFSLPDPVNAGELVGFDGMESDVTLNWGMEYEASGKPKPTYATYSWNFGDSDAADGPNEVTGYAPGAPPGEEPSSICEEPWREPCAASVFHAYHYGGTYQVRLTVTDTGGNTATITHSVTVIGPPPPSEEGSHGGGSSGSGGGSSATATPQTAPSPAATGSTGKPVVSIPAPVAAAAAASSSLAQVARRGLVVHYTVNEQVAGRFEVLLAASVAHELKIGGHPATGLPAGFPKSVVIGQALVVTTKGGHSSVRIKFPKHTARRLRHAHTVTLTLRMIVHNAGKSPLSTTVTSTVVLHR